MAEPFEIIAAPYTVYTGPVGEAFPLIDDAPAGNWAILGTSGDENYTEEGVTVALAQEVALHRVLGAAGPRKAGRITENLAISLIMVDLTLEHFAIALNGNTVSTEAAGAEAGYKKIGLSRHLSVTQYALLIRGPSPYDDDNWNMQFEVPVAVVTGSPEPVFSKGDMAGLAIEFTALDDPNAASDAFRFGQIIAMNANPT